MTIALSFTSARSDEIGGQPVVRAKRSNIAASPPKMARPKRYLPAEKYDRDFIRKKWDTWNVMAKQVVDIVSFVWSCTFTLVWNNKRFHCYYDMDLIVIQTKVISEKECIDCSTIQYQNMLASPFEKKSNYYFYLSIS